MPDQAVLAVHVMLMLRYPVIDEPDGARPRVRKYEGGVLVELCVLCGCGVVICQLTVVVREPDVRLSHSEDVSCTAFLQALNAAIILIEL